MRCIMCLKIQLPQVIEHVKNHTKAVGKAKAAPPSADAAATDQPCERLERRRVSIIRRR